MYFMQLYCFLYLSTDIMDFSNNKVPQLHKLDTLPETVGGASPSPDNGEADWCFQKAFIDVQPLALFLNINSPSQPVFRKHCKSYGTDTTQISSYEYKHK